MPHFIFDSITNVRKEATILRNRVLGFHSILFRQRRGLRKTRTHTRRAKPSAAKMCSVSLCPQLELEWDLEREQVQGEVQTYDANN